MCGEQCHFWSGHEQAIGSPPRVRGTEKSVGGNKMASRITPACAGNSDKHLHSKVQRPDHPRVCGEQPPFWYTGGTEKGSPPRVRGTGLCKKRNPWCSRITPACAGNSLISPESYGMMWDHPRVCGEQPGRPAADRAGIGSPPRVRGTVT